MSTDAVVFIDEARPAEVEGLQVGAEITYDDRCNSNRGLVYEVGPMVKVAWIDSPGLSEVPANGIRHGWRLTGRFELPAAAYAARDIAVTARAQRMQKQETAREAREERRTRGREILVDLIPTGAKAVIVAEYEEDNCDSQTDYFATTTARVVLLGFSTHTRDLFGEMRKAAEASGFAEVAHLVVGDKKQEHREKYSMGHGYYLKDSHRYDTGWTVRKHPLAGYYMDQLALVIMEEGGNQLPAVAVPVAPVTAAPVPAPAGVSCTMRENPVRKGIELIFSGKPSAAIRDRLKAAGFRWHRRNMYWYAKDYARTRALAEDLAGGSPNTPPEPG